MVNLAKIKNYILTWHWCLDYIQISQYIEDLEEAIEYYKELQKKCQSYSIYLKVMIQELVNCKTLLQHPQYIQEVIKLKDNLNEDYESLKSTAFFFIYDKITLMFGEIVRNDLEAVKSIKNDFNKANSLRKQYHLQYGWEFYENQFFETDIKLTLQDVEYIIRHYENDNFELNNYKLLLINYENMLVEFEEEHGIYLPDEFRNILFYKNMSLSSNRQKSIEMFNEDSKKRKIQEIDESIKHYEGLKSCDIDTYCYIKDKIRHLLNMKKILEIPYPHIKELTILRDELNDEYYKLKRLAVSPVENFISEIFDHIDNNNFTEIQKNQNSYDKFHKFRNLCHLMIGYDNKLYETDIILTYPDIKNLIVYFKDIYPENMNELKRFKRLLSYYRKKLVENEEMFDIYIPFEFEFRNKLIFNPTRLCKWKRESLLRKKAF